MSAATATHTTWAYQAAFRPESHPDQCYYRAEHGHCMPSSRLPNAASIQLFRFADSPAARLELSTDNGRMFTTLDAAALVTLRNAINDALHDIAQLAPAMPADDSAAARSSQYAGEALA